MTARLRTLIFGRGNQLGRKLIVFVVAFSSVITLFISAFHLFSEYRELRGTLDAQLNSVRIYVPSISVSVWDFDQQQVKRALDALILLPNVTEVTVVTADTHSHWTAGHNTSAKVLTQTYSLRHDVRGVDQEIGTLTVTASLDGIYRQVFDSAITIVVGNGLKTFLVALFMVFLIRRLITARLEGMARKAHGLIPAIRPLRQVVESAPQEMPPALDELDAVDWALNKTAEDLGIAVAALTRLNAELEARVDERTEELTTANQALVDTVQQLERTRHELVRKEKLAALGSLVAGIAHELNTPIGNAVTVATTLESAGMALQSTLKVRPLRRSEFDEFLAKSQAGAQLLTANLLRAARLIEDFKEVAVDQTSQRRRRFDLRQVVGEVLTTLRPQFRSWPGQLRNDIAAGIEIDGYPGALDQVVANLVMNAMIHGLGEAGAGTVIVAAESHDAESVEIRVCDNGQGIPRENLGRIFDPFFTTRLGQGGSGLGLSIVHNLVTTVLGGRIEVGSEPGHGTTVRVYIPRTAPTGEPTPPPPGDLPGPADRPPSADAGNP